MPRVFAALLAMALACGGCAHARNAAGRPATGILRLRCTPPAADILLDGRYLGACGRGRVLRVRAGRHRLELRSPGHFTHYAEVRVAARASVRLVVALEPRPF